MKKDTSFVGTRDTLEYRLYLLRQRIKIQDFLFVTCVGLLAYFLYWAHPVPLSTDTGELEFQAAENPTVNRVLYILNTSSEAVVGLIALTLIYLEYRRGQNRDGELKRRNAQTARYWVFYNVRNRISQDIMTLAAIDAQILAGSTKRVADCNVSFNLASVANLVGILEGYSKSWNNDDVLNRALDFDFVLLGQTEKTRMLEYFERYNHLQDEIFLNLSRLERVLTLANLSVELEFHDTAAATRRAAAEARLAADADEPAATPLRARQLDMVEQMNEAALTRFAVDLEGLRQSLRDIIEFAMVLMIVVDFSDRRHNFVDARRAVIDEIPERYRTEIEPLDRKELLDGGAPNDVGVRWPWDMERKHREEELRRRRPDSEDKWKGSDSIKILKDLVAKLQEKGLLKEREVNRMNRFRQGKDTSAMYSR